MRHRFRCIRALVGGALISVAAPVAADQFRGELDLTLTPYSSTAILCTRVSQVPAGVEVQPDDALFAGTLKWFNRNGELQMPVLLIERRQTKLPFVYVDLDRSNSFSRNERFSFSRYQTPFLTARVRAAAPPMPNTPFKQIPIELSLPTARLPMKPSLDQRYLVYSFAYFVTARVTVDAQRLYFRYGVALDQNTIDPDQGYQAVDRGRFETRALSPRRGHARGKPLVFRIGDRYLSTAAIHVLERQVLIESRSPSEYARLELVPGVVIPDFPFEDADGRTRRLSDFRGRYVLLNFWYSGCQPCVNEFPYLREAQQRFEPLGLTIIGLSHAGPNEVYPPAEPIVFPGVAATPRSVRRLIHEWFRIEATPTQILLDHSGRIVATGDMVNNTTPLRGDELLSTLDAVFVSRRLKPQVSSLKPQ